MGRPMTVAELRAILERFEQDGKGDLDVTAENGCLGFTEATLKTYGRGDQTVDLE